MSEVAADVLYGPLYSLEPLIRFLAGIIVASEQASPLIAFFIFYQENSVDGSSDCAKSATKWIIPRLDLRLFLMIEEPRLALYVVQNGSSYPRLAIGVVERTIEELLVNIHSLSRMSNIALTTD